MALKNKIKKLKKKSMKELKNKSSEKKFVEIVKQKAQCSNKREAECTPGKKEPFPLFLYRLTLLFQIYQIILLLVRA